MSGDLYINGKLVGTATDVQMPEFNKDDVSAPINPRTGKPYFGLRDDAWNGKWIAVEAQPIPSSEWGGDDER